MTLFLLATAWASVLDDPDFRFCHENRDFEYNSTLCPLLDEVPEGTCPGLESYCADPEAAPPVGCQSPAGGGPLGNRAADTVEPPDGMEPPSWWNTPALGADFARVFSWVIAFMVAFVIGGIGIALLRFVGWRRDETPPFAIVSIDDEEEQAFAEVVDDVPDLPPDDLLAAARDAVHAGRLGEAATLTRGAVLRRLGENGSIRLHRARTDREYVAQVDDQLRAELGEVLDVAGRHRWGHLPLTADVVDGALRAAARLLSLLVLLGLGVPAWAADRFGPAGDVALYRIASETLDTRFHSGELRTFDADVAAVLLDTTAIQPTNEDWDALLAWTAEGHLLIVAGATESLGDRVPVSAPCEGPFSVDPVLPGSLRGFTEGEPIVDCGSAPIAMLELGDGLLVGIADPMLVWNGAMMVDANQTLWREVFGYLDHRGWFDGPFVFATWGAAGDEDDHVGALANLALLPFVVQVLLLWAVVARWRGTPFVRQVTATGVGGRSFVEHTRAVARHYRRLGARDHATHATARWVLATRTPAALRSQAIRGGRSPEDADSLVARTLAAAEPGDSAAHDNLLEDLWTLIRARP